MGDAAGEDAEAFELLGVLDLGFEAFALRLGLGALGDVAHMEEQGGLAGVADAADADVNRDGEVVGVQAARLEMLPFAADEFLEAFGKVRGFLGRHELAGVGADKLLARQVVQARPS